MALCISVWRFALDPLIGWEEHAVECSAGSFRRDLHAFVTEDVVTPALAEVFISIFSQPPGPTPSFPRSETYPVVLAHRRRLWWIRSVIAAASGALHDRLGFGSPIHGLSTELVMKVLNIAQFDD